ncbi:MAG: hypothetical protein Unbinned5123contig1000_52 [Prokaryotic dsDNA virus sp.]|nr:MAG: hypothetical protein Unbinned5123contig1000_52 [Prokaryotic dsDNA virus sp.]|tara:strand:+ start:360 stop:4526 length:4167 start_codon:yes stop_codon:yes gene_type:complete
MAVRDSIGKIRRSAPKVGDPTLQRAIDTIYKDINKVADGTNAPSLKSATVGSIGADGDIRLYKGHGADGSIGYFLQGKFNDGWATTRLTLEAKNPEATEVLGSSGGGVGGGPEPYITRYGVTYQNLAFNNDIAGITGDIAGDGLVARGNHKHTHWTLPDPTEDGTNTEHLNTIHFPLQASANSDGEQALNVSDQAGTTGLQNVAARADHRHKLDMAPDYVWTGNNTFGDQYGISGKTVTINGPIPNNAGDSLALKVTGDMLLDGNLNVVYSQTQSSAVDLADDVALNTNNIGGGGQNTSYTKKTIIHGPTKYTAGLSVKRSAVSDLYNYHYDNADHGQNTPNVIFQDNSASGQLRLAYDSTYYFDFKIDNQGTLLLEPQGNIELKPNNDQPDGDGAVLPKGNLQVDLGTDTRKWRSVYAGELIFDNLVAQNVVSTIGGKIMVAPTSQLVQDLPQGATTYIHIEHNDSNFKNAWIFLSKGSGGTVQIEAIRTQNVDPTEVVAGKEYKYPIQTRNGDGSGANAWAKGDAVSVLHCISSGGSKGFIELTASGSVFNNNGPRITLFSATTTGETAWNAAKPMFSVGQIQGYAGFPDSDDFGLAIGNNLLLNPVTEDFRGLTVDRAKGLRMYNSPIQIYDSGTKKVEINRDGTLRLGSSLQPADVNTKADWDTENSNVGLVWDGNVLTINGIIQSWGDILQSELDDLDAADQDLQGQINAIPELDGLSNYAAAETLSQHFPGNIFLDWDFEFNPQPPSTYTDMQLWNWPANNANFQKAKSPEIEPYNGTQVMRGTSQYVDVGTNANSTCYMTDLNGNRLLLPIVRGLKFSGRMFYYIPSSNWISNPPNNTCGIGLKIYNSSKTQWMYVGPDLFVGSAASTNQWTEATGTWTVPEFVTFTAGTPPYLSGAPSYAEPYLIVDENNSNENSGTSDMYVYFDDCSLMIDSSLAMPANPTGDAAFFAGSDAFGIHDGTRWRTFFGLNANGSVMKLTNSEGTDLVTWDNDVFSIGTGIKLFADGDLKIEGDLKIGLQGSIMSHPDGYAQEGIFLGHNLHSEVAKPKFSLVKGTKHFKYDSHLDVLELANADINMVNGKMTVDNPDVNVIIGQGVGNQGSNDHDNIIIGTWESQLQSSPTGQGILVQHNTLRNANAGNGAGTNKYDYSKLDQNGFNRAGFEYPIFIGALQECPGWAGRGTSGTTWYGPKANKIFDNYNGQKIYYPGSTDLYNKVPPGRALFLQVTPAFIINNTTSSGGPWPIKLSDKDSKCCAEFQVFYRCTDDYQSSTLQYDNGFPSNHTVSNKIERLGTLFASGSQYGPWNCYITENTDVDDLRIASIFISKGNTTTEGQVQWNNIMIWEVSMDNVPAESIFHNNAIIEHIDDYPWGTGMSLSGGNPF